MHTVHLYTEYRGICMFIQYICTQNTEVYVRSYSTSVHRIQRYMYMHTVHLYTEYRGICTYIQYICTQNTEVYVHAYSTSVHRRQEIG